MILPSLLSITFRKLPAEEVVRLAAANGIRAIEWGGDVHAPPRDEEALIRVRDLTRDAGLSVCAYGSYFRIGETDLAKPGFTEVLAAAKILGAPLIRVWVGLRGSAEISTEERVAGGRGTPHCGSGPGRRHHRRLRMARWNHHRCRGISPRIPPSRRPSQLQVTLAAPSWPV